MVRAGARDARPTAVDDDLDLTVLVHRVAIRTGHGVCRGPEHGPPLRAPRVPAILLVPS